MRIFIVIGHSMATVHEQTNRQEMNDRNNFRTGRGCHPSQNKKKQRHRTRQRFGCFTFYFTPRTKTVTSSIKYFSQ